MREQIISLLGAVLILMAYGANNFGWLNSESAVYILMNLIGSLILAIIAARAKQLGLTLLEGVWFILSAASLMKHLA